MGVRAREARLLKVSAAKVSEVPRMSAIPPPKHPAVDITSPPENPELAIAMHFAETASERSTAELLWALPHLKGANRVQIDNVVWSPLRLRDARRQKPAVLLVGRKHL